MEKVMVFQPKTAPELFRKHVSGPWNKRYSDLLTIKTEIPYYAEGSGQKGQKVLQKIRKSLCQLRQHVDKFVFIVPGYFLYL